MNLNKNTKNVIKPIEKGVVHRICSGQVVLNLGTAVKELVENSLDAGATTVDIRLKYYGSEIVEVSDNGCGVHPDNFQALTLKHHTSKLQDFSDLLTVETFGFRGEALSSLCALSDITIITRHTSSKCATQLTFNCDGDIVSSKDVARQVGTTVILKNIFYSLPVRQKEFQNNIKREFAKMTQLLYSYCLVATGVKIHCVNQTKSESRTTVVSTQGCKTYRENIACVFGTKQLANLLEWKQEPTEEFKCHLEGYVSSCAHGSGRAATDRQFYYINARPCEPTKLIRAVNEVYHQYNLHQSPFVFLNIKLPRNNVDVNVTPDKRQIFVDQENLLIENIKGSLHKMFESIPSTFSLNNVPVNIMKKFCNKPAASEDSAKETTLNNLEETNSIISKENIEIEETNSSQNESNVEINNSSICNQSDRGNKTEKNCKEGKTKVSQWTFGGKRSIDNVTTVTKNPKQMKMDNIFQKLSPKSFTSSVENEADVTESNLRDLSTSCIVLDGSSTSDRMTSNSIVTCNEKEVTVNENKEKSSDIESKINTNELIDTSQKEEINKEEYSSGIETSSINIPSEDYSVSEGIECNSSDVSQSPNNIKKESGSTVKEICLNLDRIRTLYKRKLEEESTRTEASIRFRALIDPTKNNQAEQELSREISKAMFSQMDVIGQFNLGFIIARLKSDLFIVDQHATDEKYNFETLQKTTSIKNQRLVIPQKLELTAINECTLVENIEVFKANGFEFLIDEQAPVTKRISLTSVPVSKNLTFGKEDVDELLFMLQGCQNVMCRPSRVRAMFASRACRKSVMIGTALTKSKMKTLLTHMGEIEQPWNCPHGRPTMRHLVNLDLYQ